MTIKNLYPKSRPQTIYNVINGRPELPAASAFSRDSIGTYVDSGGIIQTAAAGEPRFNHDPATGEFLGLLLEQESTNLEAFSVDVNQIGESGNMTWIPNAGLAPDGTNTANSMAEKDITPGVNAQHYISLKPVPIIKNSIYRVSFYVKNVSLSTDSIYVTTSAGFPYATAGANVGDVTDSPQGYHQVTQTDAGNGWYRISMEFTANSDQAASYFYLDYRRLNGDSGDITTGYMLVWGFQIERNIGYYPTSLIPTSGTAITRPTDEFSLTSSNNFDGGFSLVLDSDTTTKSFLYRIKATQQDGSKLVISELKNVNGTLEWDINGTSAQTDGLYPQVGFVNGRVRTVSSYGAADGTVQNNYLYTTGLSFPTPAVVAPGADELEFGVPQTLKALYLWSGQLSDTEAVSVIKGEYNVVPIEPIKGDSYSFVYNTDPDDKGVTSMDLPTLIPTISMRVYWGDGTSQRYEQGVTPQHTYPYPGQYRIQVVADDGFDSVQLGGIDASVITRVDQWAPQHRADASGDGFTGEELTNLLSLQYTNKTIPKFKYTGVTNIDAAFRNNGQVPPNGGMNSSDPDWGWVPTNLPDVTNVNNAFYGVSQVPSDPAMETFPQLQTSDKLTSANYTFYGTAFNKFPTNGLPFSNTSGLKKWIATFAYSSRLTEIGNLDTGIGTNFNQLFDNCIRLEKMPFMDFRSAGRDGLDYTWNKCEKLEDPFPAISLGNTRQLNYTWANCQQLQNFPLLDLKEVTSLFRTWYQCYALGKDQEFPAINTANVISIEGTWFYNSGHKTFPKLNFNKLQYAQQGWYLNSSLTTFPAIDFPECTNFTQAWANCYSLTTFPNVDVSKGQIFVSTWQTLKDLESFPALEMPDGRNFETCWLACGEDSGAFTTFPRVTPSNTYCFPKGEAFGRAWERCPALENFPQNAFSPTVTFESDAFSNAWLSCALTAQSIEYILVSLNANPTEKVELSIAGGTNADYKDWSAAAKTAYQGLIDKDWDIDLNDVDGLAPATLSATSGFYVNSQDGVVSFGELTPGSRHASGKANQEVIDDEGAAIDRVLELDENFFPDWDREGTYQAGDRVKFGRAVYRALQENDIRFFELPDLKFNPDAEVATPMNRQARWVEVYDPNYDEEMMMGLPE